MISKSKNEFIKNLNKKVGLASKHPESFPVSKKDVGLRKYVVTKQTVFLYKVKTNGITIVTIFDSRENPTKQNR